MTCDTIEGVSILQDNSILDGWSFSASSAASGSSAARLTQPGRKQTWESSATASTHWVEAANISGQTMDLEAGGSVALINFVIPESAVGTTVEIQMWDAPAAGTLIYDEFFSLYNYSALSDQFKSLLNSVQTYKNRVIYIARAVSGIDRIRVTFDQNTANPHVAKLGRLLVQQPFRPDDNFYNGQAMVTQTDDSRVTATQGGDITSDTRPKSRGLSIETPSITILEDVIQWSYLFNVVGKREPIFVDAYPRIPDVNFVPGEEVLATQNLLHQIYGTNTGDCGIAWSSKNTAKTSGGILIMEQA